MAQFYMNSLIKEICESEDHFKIFLFTETMNNNILVSTG